MYGVTDKFRAAYSYSHLIVATGSIQDGNGNIITPVLQFDLTGRNEVSVDVTSANRRTCSLAIVDDGTLLPLDAKTSPLTPVANEIVLARGIRFVDGTAELVPQGIFGIQEANEARSPAGPIVTITGTDRSKRLDVILTHHLTFAAGSNFGTIISALADASGVVYTKSYDVTVTTATSPKVLFAVGDNIWEKIQDIAASLGCWAYFDVLGNLVVEPVPDPSTAEAEWIYAAGAQAVFDDTTRALTLEDGSAKAYSHAIVQSNVHTKTAPLRSDAFDTDPSSPTYYLGPFGDRAIFDDNTSGFITNQAQCDAAAAALLRRNYGILEKVTFRAMPNPAFSGGDIISLADPETNTAGVYVAETFNMPLHAAGGSMSGTFRTRQLR